MAEHFLDTEGVVGSNPTARTKRAYSLVVKQIDGIDQFGVRFPVGPQFKTFFGNARTKILNTEKFSEYLPSFLIFGYNYNEYSSFA